MIRLSLVSSYRKMFLLPVFILVSFFLAQQVYATCVNGSSVGPDVSTPGEWCDTTASGTSYGVEVYSCGTYYIKSSDSYQYACYWHNFDCTTPCSTGGTPTGGGGCVAGKEKKTSYECMSKTYGCESGYGPCEGSQCLSCKRTQVSCSRRRCECVTTRPSGIVGVRTSGTTATIDWTSGYKETNTRLYIGANQAQVNGGCTTAGCVVKELSLPANTTHYEATGLDPAVARYYIRVDTWVASGSDCNLYATSSFEGIACPAMTPPTGITVTPGSSTTTANMTWTPGTGGDSQIIYVGSNEAAVSADCSPSTSCVANAVSVGAGVSSYTLSGLTPGATYYAKVSTAFGGASCSQDSTITDYAPAVGYVYVNDDPSSCSTTTPMNGGGVTVEANNGTETYTATVGADGSYVVAFPAGGTMSLSLSNLPAQYVCSTACSATGCNLTGVPSGTSSNNFFVTLAREPWWQAVGAGVYAGSTGAGVTIRSELPSASSRLIIPGVNSVAALVRASSGAPDIGAATQVSSTGWSAVSKYTGKRMDYQFFATNMGVISSTSDNVTGDSISKPTYDPNKDFWYQNGTATIDSAWSVGNTESYVIFVNGDLEINANITVPDGGFLAFIVKGDVRVAPSVTSIQGLYVMDDVFITTSQPGGDVALDVEGTIVTWSGVSLERDLDTGNLSIPAESFTYRPDLISNMPDKMKVFALRWQEVAPGTFGE